MTVPDPRLVREIARKWLSDPDLGSDELDYIVRLHVGYGVPDEEFDEWRACVVEAADDATKTVTVTWPDEKTQDEAERDADVRVVARVLAAERPSGGVDWSEWTLSFQALRDRFAGRVAAMEATSMRTPEQWCAHYDVVIQDPDGWRGVGDPGWDEPITLPDFWDRASRSTLRSAVSGNWDQVARDARASAPCDSRAHRDFVGDQDVRCTLPAGHVFHRNGKREWMP